MRRGALSQIKRSSLIWITAPQGFCPLTCVMMAKGNRQGGGAGDGSRRTAVSRPEDGHPEGEEPVLAAVAEHRLLLLLRGAAALLFAFFAFFWPRLTITGLAVLWGGYSLVDGILALTAAIRAQSASPRIWLGLIGVAGIGCAGATLFALDLVAAHLVGIISIWAISTGALQIWAALELRTAVDQGWVLALDGVGSLLFGLALALWPGPELQALVWVTGWFALALGSLFWSIGFWLGRSN